MKKLFKVFKRLFDIFFSIFGLIIILPVLLIISVFVFFDSKGGIFYLQKRVGKRNTNFNLFKFRSMIQNAEKTGLLTVGARDNRITKVGFFLRKYKLDELPQLLNVLIGDMSFVGPRPEVRKYVDLYNKEQLNVLNVKPGITDLASIRFINENEILAGYENPEDAYIKDIMPLKLKINLEYISKANVLTDIKIIIQTIFKVFR
ncbi:MAG: glycosyl transferase [Bacteroidetes bacterium GWA2_30_7]|nr:MAG: glycosyl transferase [Bacteroidetes bacterium GWA2_30_7]